MLIDVRRQRFNGAGKVSVFGHQLCVLQSQALVPLREDLIVIAELCNEADDDHEDDRAQDAGNVHVLHSTSSAQVVRWRRSLIPFRPPLNVLRVPCLITVPAQQ